MKSLSFLEHIEELRKRVIEYIIFLIASISISFFFVKDILHLLTRLIDQQIVMLVPQEGFLAILKIGVTSGFIISLPFLVIQIWRYVSQGLTKQEKGKLKAYALFSILLFLFGVSISYFIVIPLGLIFLIRIGEEFFKPMISINGYLSFITLLFFVFGLIFQLPLIILFLNSIGMVSKQQLKEKREYFYLIAFIVGAILTPPDALTQIALAIPLILLYEISYLIIVFREKTKHRLISNNPF